MGNAHRLIAAALIAAFAAAGALAQPTSSAAAPPTTKAPSVPQDLEPSVDTSGLNAESGMRDDSVRLANTICSITCPCASHSCVLSGMAVESSIHRR